MPTKRGWGLLVMAVAAYMAGRVVGTYEFYFAAIALTAVVVVSLLMVWLTGRRLELKRTFHPPESVAGDSAELQFYLHNQSFWPSTALSMLQPLPRLAGVQVVMDIGPLAPRGQFVMSEALSSLRRGVFAADPAVLTFTDPLGAARRRRTLDDGAHLTVLPRIAPLRSCIFFGSGALVTGRRTRPLPMSGAVDLRGVRPHQPGESLSHIDWKSTAKTGVLMLREMEEPARTEVIMVLDGTRSAQVGEPQQDTFETAVAVIGSVGDLVLREGFGVTLLRHDASDDYLRFEADQRTRRDLQLALAEASAEASAGLSTCLRTNRTRLARGLAVVVVTPILEPPTLHELIGLAGRGVPVFLVYIDPASFGPDARSGGDAHAWRDAHAGGGARPALDSGQLDPQERGLLLGLQAGGVPSVTVRRHDDLADILSAL